MARKKSHAGAWPDPPLRSKKVAIVGFATESIDFAPFENPEYEVWILNMLHKHVPRWDRLWELHDRETLNQETAELKRSMDHLGTLQAERERPIYMLEHFDDIPMSKRFPIETMTAYLASLSDKWANAPYYTSTFAYMLATAVMGIVNLRANPFIPEPGEHIVIAGVELLNNEEYAYQRSCAEFWIGLVMGKGIRCDIAPRSALLESDGLYCYARPESLELLSRMREYYNERRKSFEQKKAEAATRRDQAKADVNSYDGAIQMAEWTINHLTYLMRGGKV